MTRTEKITRVEPLKVSWRVVPADYGKRTAEWLNALGPDAAPYGQQGPHKKNGKVLTNLDIRRNWVDGVHVRWVRE
jgi:hypothetical protein